MIIVFVIIIGILSILVCYASLIVASDADDMEELALMRYEQTCETCKYNEQDETSAEYYCECEDSEYFGFNTDWVEDCDEWQEKGR